jgi:hypothetical protein
VSLEQTRVSSASSLVSTDDRRQYDRVSGPFDARRIGILTTPLRIYDLSEGGCFVNSMHEQQPGIAFTLEIDLPYAGTLTFRAETIYRKPEFGFAVRFIGVSDETAAQLHDALERLRAEQGQ